MIVSMNWQKIYVGSKKIHTISMWGTLAFGLPQLTTGLILSVATNNLTLMIAARTIHAFLAPYFAIFLGIQMLTGAAVWLSPRVLAKLRSKSEANPTIK